MNSEVNEIVTWLKNNGIDPSLFLAGAMGGFVKNGSERELSVWERIFIICSGAASATYLTPLIASLVGWNNEHLYGLAFVVGYLGLSLVEVLAHIVHKKMNKDKKD
jgi:hypothetical protein